MKDPCIKCDKSLTECRFCLIAPVLQEPDERDALEPKPNVFAEYFQTKQDQEFDR